MQALVGIITKMPSDLAAGQLRRMLSCVSRDRATEADKDSWNDASLGVYVGFVRQKLASSDRSLLRNERGDILLAFSGDDFPDPESGEFLRRRGHQFEPKGCSYLVHLAEENDSFPAMLNGLFHGLVIDLGQRTAMLFNDRYGMHRLYYHESPDAFYIASEAKAILAVRPELRRIDNRSLGEFVSCGAVLEDRTLFQGIHALPPASSWTFRNGLLAQKASYFQPKEWEEQEALSTEAFYQELRRVFVRNLPRYFAGDQRIGLSLTGGLDTRMILANHNADPGSLPCYTFGSMFRENQDVSVARRVAETCGQTFEILTAGPTFLSEFPSYAERTIYLTDGCADVSRAPDLYLNERAREIAPIRMTGLYGGEILRGVRALKPVEPAAGLFAAGFSTHFHRAASTCNEIARCHPVSFAVFRQGPWCLRGSLSLEETQLSMRTPYLDNDFVRTVFRAPASALGNSEVSMRLIADGNKAMLDIPTDRGVGGKRHRASASAAHAALEFLFKAEYAYDSGMPQWLARIDHSLAPLHLERAFLGRHKPFHFRIWYRDTLAAYVQEMLLDERALSRPYVDRKGLENVVRGHVIGNRNYTNELHKLLTLELIHRLFLDHAGSGQLDGLPGLADSQIKLQAAASNA
jgi:asparagine synthase (glutamine-hydrolysing)